MVHLREWQRRAVVGVVTLGGCAVYLSHQTGLLGPGDPSVPVDPFGPGASQEQPAPEVSQNADGSIQLGAGARLVAGVGGKIPVKVRWIRSAICPDGLAVHEDRAYVFGCDSFDAVDLDDGDTAWSAGPPDDIGMESSGGVEIGSTGTGRVLALAPGETSIEVDEDSGDLLSYDEKWSPRLTPYDQGREQRELGITELADGSTVQDTLNTVTMIDPSGRTLWRIEVSEPMFDTLGPIEVDDGLVLVLADELMLRLDPVG